MSRFKAVTSSNGLLAIDNLTIRFITKEIAIIRWDTTLYAARYSSMESQYAMELECFIDDGSMDPYMNNNFSAINRIDYANIANTNTNRQIPNSKVYSSTIDLTYYEFNETKKFSHFITGLKHKHKYKINIVLYEIRNNNPVQLVKSCMTYSNNIKYYDTYVVASFFARKYCTINTFNTIEDALFVFIASMLNYVHFDTEHPKIRVANDNLTAICKNMTSQNSMQNPWSMIPMHGMREKYATIIFGEFLHRRNQQIFEAKFCVNEGTKNQNIRFGFVTDGFESGYQNDHYDIHQFDYNSVVCFAGFYNNDQMRVRNKFKNIKNNPQFNDYKLQEEDVIIVEINMHRQKGNIYFLKNKQRELIFSTSLPDSCAICLSFMLKMQNPSNEEVFKVTCVDQRWLRN